MRGIVNPKDPRLRLKDCYDVDQQTGRRSLCTDTHLRGEGQGQMNTLSECDVKISFLVPVDLVQTPYIIIASHGIHSHPPPPPKKVPSDILIGLMEVMDGIGREDITVGQLHNNPAIAQFCEQHGGKTLADIAAGLANYSRLYLTVLAYRLRVNPFGCGIDGVMHLFEQERHDKDTRYIQSVIRNGQCHMVICFHKAQAEPFRSGHIRTFQVDMNYKHLKYDKEIVWATKIPEVVGSIPLVRVITNIWHAEAFQLMFTEVFGILREAYGIEVLWEHIHGVVPNSFIDMTVDQDWACMKGFGQYLHTVDPTHSFKWHIRQTVRLCSRHFNQGVKKVLDTANIRGAERSDLGSRMYGLLQARSSRKYYAICRRLQRSAHFRVSEWAKHKANKVIASGFNKFCSPMPQERREALQGTSNVVESEHEARYKGSGDRYTSALSCVKHNARYDDKRMSHLAVTLKFDIRKTRRVKPRNDFGFLGTVYGGVGVKAVLVTRLLEHMSLPASRDNRLALDGDSSATGLTYSQKAEFLAPRQKRSSRQKQGSQTRSKQGAPKTPKNMDFLSNYSSSGVPKGGAHKPKSNALRRQASGYGLEYPVAQSPSLQTKKGQAALTLNPPPTLQDCGGDTGEFMRRFEFYCIDLETRKDSGLFVKPASSLPPSYEEFSNPEDYSRASKLWALFRYHRGHTQVTPKSHSGCTKVALKSHLGHT
ncbi:hypothetical protein QBC40DRAFT_351776 [Triangularia verruculosa]|uniref:Uncharacterized protein n=1 Tax=Triangularia verruculosa TaxID=2587418 RepID=A0AAN6X9H5_9PEZI|nr:hypothetical protein QBC40DRAFT_351776 [Triangularia verruculosa]